MNVSGKLFLAGVVLYAVCVACSLVGIWTEDARFHKTTLLLLPITIAVGLMCNEALKKERGK